MKIFLFAGEHSGDLHGEGLIHALKAKYPRCQLMGVGGPRMREAGLETFIRMEKFQVMGYSDVILALPRLAKLFFRVRDEILRQQPDAVVCIDYPGFNLRLERSLRKRQFKGRLIHFVCPMVWAHGKKRIHTLAENVDMLLSILPFEPPLFDNTQLSVEYIGHPLIGKQREHKYMKNWRQVYNIPDKTPLLGIFPGSRIGEIQRNLSKQLKAAEIISRRHENYIWVIPVAHPELRPLILQAIAETPFRLGYNLFLVEPQHSYDLMKSCHAAIATSGTVTAELALHEVPTVVNYQLSFLNFMIATCVLRLNLPHYCLVNIIRNRRVYPEIYDYDVNPQHIVRQLLPLLEDGPARDYCIEGCREVAELLGKTHASERAASLIGDLIHA